MKKIRLKGPLLVVAVFIAFITVSGVVASVSTEKKSSKHEVAINTYSLLYELLTHERDVKDILAITRERKSIDPLIREISSTSQEALTSLDDFQNHTPNLNFTLINLPQGEVLTRKAIEKTKSKELLTSTGKSFSVKLLLTQTEALSYASHLASVAASYDTNPERASKMAAYGKKFEKLYAKTVELLISESASS